MIKMRRVTRIIPILVLLALLASLVPLAGTACSEDEEDLVADFLGAPTAGTAPLDVAFVDKSTGDIESWAWTFGDGETSTAQNPTHTYAAEGVYDVSLTVTKGDNTDTETKTGYIEVADIVAEFSADPTSGEVTIAISLPVQFTDLSVGTVTSWEWDLDGDGLADSTDQNPSHTYTTAGAYDISLRVEGPDGTNTETKADYITVTDHVYAEMELTISGHLAANDPSSLAGEKLAELLEEYTGGKVTCNTHWGESLYLGVEQFPALQTGALDIAIQHPGFLRGYDVNLDPLGGVPYMPNMSVEWTRACAVDPDVLSFLDNIYSTHDVKFGCYIESTVIAGYMSTFAGPFDDYEDLDGMKYAQYRAGPLDPVEAYYGAIGVPVSMTELAFAIQNGDCETIPFPAASAWGTGLYALFNSTLFRQVYSPVMMLTSMDTWNDMEPELQALITDIIVPQMQETAFETSSDALKQALFGLNQALSDGVHFVPMARDVEIYNDLLPTLDAWLARKAAMDPDIVALIEAVEPATHTLSPFVAEILDFAGIDSGE